MAPSTNGIMDVHSKQENVQMSDLAREETPKTDNVPDNGATTFDRFFPRLPYELQWAIWTFAAWDTSIQGRCILVHNHHDDKHFVKPTALNPLPALFSTCVDARHAALASGRWRFSLGHPAALPCRDGSGVDKTFPNNLSSQLVDLENDIVFFELCCPTCSTACCAKGRLSADDRASIRHVAVQLPSILPSAAWVDVPEVFSSVQMLYIIPFTVDLTHVSGTPRGADNDEHLHRTLKNIQQDVSASRQSRSRIQGGVGYFPIGYVPEIPWL